MVKEEQTCATIKIVKSVLLGAALTVSCGGCAVPFHITTGPVPAPAEQAVTITAAPAPAANPPGVREYVWEEPMVHNVEVPPGLDPEGIYYRPAHQEIIEIRQGRWQYYKEPGDK